MSENEKPERPEAPPQWLTIVRSRVQLSVNLLMDAYVGAFRREQKPQESSFAGALVISTYVEGIAGLCATVTANLAGTDAKVEQKIHEIISQAFDGFRRAAFEAKMKAGGPVPVPPPGNA